MHAGGGKKTSSGTVLSGDWISDGGGKGTERSVPAQDGRIPASVLVCHEEATSGAQWRLLTYSAAGSSRE